MHRFDLSAVVTLPLLLLLVGIPVACTQPVEPNPAADPEIASLEIDAEALRSGLLVVRAVPVEPTVVAAKRAAIELSVQTSSGATRMMAAEPEVCVVPPGTGLTDPLGNDYTGAEYVCNQFLMGLVSPSDAWRLGPHLDAIDGHLRLPPYIEHGPISASVRIFSGDVFEAMRAAKKWPGVRYVEISGFWYTAAGPPHPPAFVGAVAVDLDGQQPGSRSLVVRPGDTITVTYRQPDGTTLTEQVTSF
jgi:hypothetical protein